MIGFHVIRHYEQGFISRRGKIGDDSNGVRR